MKNKDYQKISTYFFENIFIVIVLCITGIIFNSLMAFIPKLEGNAINSLALNDPNTVLKYVIILISLVIFVQINRFIKRYYTRVFANRMYVKMANLSFNNILNRDITYFEKENVSDLLNKNTTDIQDTCEGIRKMTTEVFDTFILLLGYIVMMFIMNYQLTLISILFIGCAILVSYLIKGKVYKYNKQYKEYLSEYKGLTLNTISNQIYYRGLGVEKRFYNKYLESNKKLKRLELKSSIFQNCFQPIYALISAIGIFFIAYLMGKEVLNNSILIGDFSAFLTIYLLVATKANKLGKLFNAYQGFKVSFIRIKPFLLIKKENLVKNNTSFDKLELKEFSFVYDKGFILPKVNLNAKKGQIIGVCGSVHTGKSTFLKGLTGLYSYTGQAKLNLCDLSNIHTFSNQIISYCENDIHLFNDILKNNITLKNKGNLDLAYKSSLLNLDFTLDDLNRNISSTYLSISGGQQKRVGVARSLYNESFLILLDDPFKSLNDELALQLFNNLKIFKDSIIILVSNNYQILKDCSKIVYFNKDKAVVDDFANLIKIKDFQDLLGVKL